MILPFYADSTDSSIHPHFTVRTHLGFYLHPQVLILVQSFYSKRRFCNRGDGGMVLPGIIFESHPS